MPHLCVGCEQVRDGCVRSFVGWVCPACAEELVYVQRAQAAVNAAARRRRQQDRRRERSETQEGRCPPTCATGS